MNQIKGLGIYVYNNYDVYVVTTSNQIKNIKFMDNANRKCTSFKIINAFATLYTKHFVINHGDQLNPTNNLDYIIHLKLVVYRRLKIKHG